MLCHGCVQALFSRASTQTCLHVQVQKLELKLAELHATDVKALDRAYQSQCQHVDALQLESTVCALYCDIEFLLGAAACPRYMSIVQ